MEFVAGGNQTSRWHSNQRAVDWMVPTGAQRIAINIGVLSSTHGRPMESNVSSAIV